MPPKRKWRDATDSTKGDAPASQSSDSMDTKDDNNNNNNADIVVVKKQPKKDSPPAPPKKKLTEQDIVKVGHQYPALYKSAIEKIPKADPIHLPELVEKKNKLFDQASDEENW